RRMRATSTGARLLRDQPDIVAILEDREALARLPAGSLGRAYLAFMEAEGISAAGIKAASVKGRTLPHDGATAREYFERRMRDTHALWHAVTGYGGDVLGEAALLAFTLAQTGNPGIGLIVGAALLKARHEKVARAIMLDGFRRGLRAAWFVDVEWEAQ